jgi:hypothetical protein
LRIKKSHDFLLGRCTSLIRRSDASFDGDWDEAV